MEGLAIHISKEGIIRISIDGLAIGLIEDFRIECVGNSVRVKVSFPDIKSYAESESKTKLEKTIELYKKLFKELPFVQLFDEADTLPTGMPAVKPE
jgi:hypothetical protein